MRNTKLTKKSGERRKIESPSSIQKEKQREIVERLRSKGELDFEEFNFSIKGAKKAVKKFEEYRDDGYQWIAKLDVKSCFPSIDPDDVLSLIDCKVEDVPEITDRKGLPQGHPLSNFLAEIYLDQFDKKVNDWPENGCKVIRYVDDIWLMCKKKREVEIYFKFAVRYLNDLNLSIHSDSDSGASVKHVNEGVEVLGFIVDRWSKWPLPEKVSEHKQELIGLLLRALESEDSDNTDLLNRIHSTVSQWKTHYSRTYISYLQQWIHRILQHTRRLQC